MHSRNNSNQTMNSQSSQRAARLVKPPSLEISPSLRTNCGPQHLPLPPSVLRVHHLSRGFPQVLEISILPRCPSLGSLLKKVFQVRNLQLPSFIVPYIVPL